MTDDQMNNLPPREETPEEEQARSLPAQEREAAPGDPRPAEAALESAPSQESGSQETCGPADEDQAPLEENLEESQAPAGEAAAPNQAPAQEEPAAQQAPPPQPWGYPPYGPQGPWMAYGQPPYGVPQNGYPGCPGQGWYPCGQPPKPPRKKMSRSLKVFLWIASALTAGVIVGFAIFVISWAVAGPQQSLVETLPEESQQEESAPEEQQEETPALELPDVDVTPNEEGIVIHSKPEGDALDAQEVYNRVVQSTVAITASRTGETTDSAGTGIIATSDGYIITNAHVVLNTKSVLVTVTTYDGQQYDAVVVGMDRTTDLAVIKTNDYGFTPAEFGDSDQLSLGEWVVAIGNPGGERFASSLTRGIVSGLDRAVERYSEEGMTYIQTDAAINPGNSGGPLVNMYGQVVGINSSKIITDGYEGMGFAIPVSKAKDIIDQLLSGGYVEGRVRLGITGSDVTAAQSAFYGIPQGFVIASIDEDSSFAGTQAQPNDIIIAIDGETVEELQDISNLLLRYSPGDQVTVTLYRQPENGMGEGEEFDVTITLLEDKGETQR